MRPCMDDATLVLNTQIGTANTTVGCVDVLGMCEMHWRNDGKAIPKQYGFGGTV